MKGNELNIISKRIKEIRMSKNIKLIDVASSAGISKGLLSKIENSRTMPSLTVLFNIISALDENPSSFFENIEYVGNAPFYILKRESEYEPIEKEDSVGYNYFSIFSRTFKDVGFNAVLLKLDPKAKREMVTTDGMEFIYLIEGDITYKLDTTEFDMSSGDSLFFDGRIPHLKINKSTKEAKILVIYLLFN